MGTGDDISDFPGTGEVDAAGDGDGEGDFDLLKRPDPGGLSPDPKAPPTVEGCPNIELLPVISFPLIID